ncbi:MAG: phosphatidylglycerol lysyltransferase domain-containing protein [Kofleriaceae bacterium]
MIDEVGVHDPGTAPGQDPSRGPVTDRDRALGILRRHGWTTVSFQLLEPEFRYWFCDDDAFVAYVDTGSAWVAGGAPVAAEHRLVSVANAFVDAARVHRRRACFFACEQRFVTAVGWSTLAIGEQPVWRAGQWEGVMRSASSLRYQLRRAAAKGVTVRRLTTGELDQHRVAIHNLALEWLAARKMAPMGFLVQLEPISFPDERVMIVAMQGARLVGFLSAIPVYSRGRWFIEDVLRTSDAPNGTPELLIDAAMRDPQIAQHDTVTLGLAPLAGAVPALLRFARVISTPLYDFRGLGTFKRKLRPHAWEPVYLCAPTWRWRALTDSLSAFAGGSIVSFAARTLLQRRPRWLLPARSTVDAEPDRG